MHFLDRTKRFNSHAHRKGLQNGSKTPRGFVDNSAYRVAHKFHRALLRL